MLIFQPEQEIEPSSGRDGAGAGAEAAGLGARGTRSASGARGPLEQTIANMWRNDTSAKIASAFDAAATTYDSNSALQRRVADELIGQARTTRPKTILDIGCGTGHLTKRIAERWPEAQITALDVSRAMLDEVARKLPNARTIRCDAAAIASSQTYDLIFSSMALHWMPDPRAVLARWSRLLNASGQLHVALPIEGSLHEWREACAAAGMQDGLWGFPSADFAEGLGRSATTKAHSLLFRSAREFLDSMRKTGADTARIDHRPMPAGRLRRLLEIYGDRFIATYRVLYLSA